MYGTRTGDMPDGRMTVTKHSYSLPGYEEYGTYEITYDFEAGVHVSFGPLCNSGLGWL